MRYRTHKIFDKKYAKLREGEKQRFKERRNLFLENSTHPALNNHSLHGKYVGYWSINIGGNLRALYKYETNGAIIFTDIDTHPNLYGK